MNLRTIGWLLALSGFALTACDMFGGDEAEEEAAAAADSEDAGEDAGEGEAADGEEGEGEDEEEAPGPDAACEELLSAINDSDVDKVVAASTEGAARTALGSPPSLSASPTRRSNAARFALRSRCSRLWERGTWNDRDIVAPCLGQMSTRTGPALARGGSSASYRSPRRSTSSDRPSSPPRRTVTGTSVRGWPSSESRRRMSVSWPSAPRTS